MTQHILDEIIRLTPYFLAQALMLWGAVLITRYWAIPRLLDKKTPELIKEKMKRKDDEIFYLKWELKRVGMGGEDIIRKMKQVLDAQEVETKK